MALVTGIDGCKAGWIAIALETDTGDLSHAVHPGGESLFAATTESHTIAIDIPIGLPESGARVIDSLLWKSRRLRDRVYESHPEVGKGKAAAYKIKHANILLKADVAAAMACRSASSSQSLMFGAVTAVRERQGIQA